MRIGVVRTVGSPCRCAESVGEGLHALGHGVIFADSEKIELEASGLAQDCDLVIDHTDTFHGRGFFRPLVRLILEARGARIVGSDSRACFLADDKASAKERMAACGVSVPPGIVAESEDWRIPRWLKPPLVLKPAFEHMSRGLTLAATEEEAYAAASGLLRTLRQPVLVETYIPGREMAVSLVAGPAGLEVLPPLEWQVALGEGMLTEAFKLTPVAGDRRDAVPADLSPGSRQEIGELARRAFEVLGLRDYARFDLKLSPGGTFFFLEANTTPSFEPQEALALSARWAGLDYPALVERLLSSALGRYGHGAETEEKRTQIDLATGPVELKVPPGVHHPPQSTIDLARLLDVKPGERVLELGCGTGLLSIAAAKLGARRVVATDVDPRALEAAGFNARANGVDDRIEIRAGSWYEALKSLDPGPGEMERFDVIIATPPQTPGPRPFGPRYGGADGTRHLFSVIRGARDFLEPGRGRLWLLAISLANSAGLRQCLEEEFSAVTVVQETERRFTAEEYEAMEEGLFRHLLALRSSGRSDFREAGKGQYVFRNLFLRASGLRVG